jgi:two-component system, NtrC family, sensor kinase
MEITRIAHITRQTLGFYRDLRAPAVLDLSQSVTDALELYKSRFANKRIDIQLKLDEDVHIHGVKGEIRQVISNLLINAVEAMESQGRIDIHVYAQGEEAVLSISDTGPGIQEELVQKIFEPFFTTKQGTGTGLGLWITRTIIEKHGGRIEVSTRRGERDHGTSFEIRFAKKLGQQVPFQSAH